MRGDAAWWRREFETMCDLMSRRDHIIERLLCNGEVWQGGEVIAYQYDPMTHSTEGLDDACFFCGSDRVFDRPQPHESDCPWIAAMDLRGHAHPNDVAIEL